MHIDAAGRVTPEGTRIDADVAGIGSRSIALVVDTLIQVLLCIPVFLLALNGAITGFESSVVALVILFIVLWVYFPAFEWLWRGQTPGKRFQGIRVIGTSGQPASFAQILVRNLIRIIDVIAMPFLALISMFVTQRSQRLGDLAAGTMVVHERKLRRPGVTDLGPVIGPALPTIDTTGLDERDYTVLRTFLDRRNGLDEVARWDLARRLASRIRERTGAADMADERLIEATVQSYRARFRDPADPGS